MALAGSEAIGYFVAAVFDMCSSASSGCSSALRRAARFGAVLAVVCATAAYFVLPFLWNRGAVCEVEHRKWKFDSVGFAWLGAALRSVDIRSTRAEPEG